MSLSGSLSGRVGALGAAAAALLSRAGRALPAPAAGSAGADLEELLLATPAERALSMAQTAALVERITMEADLRTALVAGDLVLRFTRSSTWTRGRRSPSRRSAAGGTGRRGCWGRRSSCLWPRSPA